MGCCSTVPRRNWCRQLEYANVGSWRRQCYTDTEYPSHVCAVPILPAREVLGPKSKRGRGGSTAIRHNRHATLHLQFVRPITSRRRSVDSNKIGKGETWERYQQTRFPSPLRMANNDCSWRMSRAGRTQHVSVGTRRKHTSKKMM